MLALVWLVIIALGSLLIVRLGTIAYTTTGLRRDMAEFQAYSAFFGVGFTTRESEQVVNHPVRRRITQHLILAGQIGFASVIVPLVVTFVNVKTLSEGLRDLGLIAGALSLLWALTTTSVFDAVIERSVQFALRRATPFRQVLDHEVLLRLDAGFTVCEVALGAGHALVGCTLAMARLAEHGVVVLGITRADGTYLGTPRGSTVCQPMDVLTVYGREGDVNRVANGSVDAHRLSTS